MPSPTTEEDLLATLALRVRALTLSQVRRTWWQDTTEPACRLRLRRLADRGLVSVSTVLVHDELELSRPLATWQPGFPAPDLRGVSHAAESRWRDVPRATLCAVATVQTGVRFAGRGGRAPRETEWTHDLQLAQVYLHLRHADPERAELWQHEDLADRSKSTRPAPGERVPDVLLLGPTSRLALELVGRSYDLEDLVGFHGYCRSRELPYELW